MGQDRSFRGNSTGRLVFVNRVNGASTDEQSADVNGVRRVIVGRILRKYNVQAPYWRVRYPAGDPPLLDVDTPKLGKVY